MASALDVVAFVVTLTVYIGLLALATFAHEAREVLAR